MAIDMPIDPLVYAEWVKSLSSKDGSARIYASGIAMRWLVDMQSSGRVDTILIDQNSEFRQLCINGLQNNPRTVDSVGPVVKDFHLVETAIMSDRRVLSMDVRIIGHLSHLHEIANEICSIMWVNPVHDQAESWLRDGAAETAKYHICEPN